MQDHKIKSIELARLLNVSTGLVSDMLNYKKGLSKDTIRILAEKFKVTQEAFNRPYKTTVVKVKASNRKTKKERVSN